MRAVAALLKASRMAPLGPQTSVRGKKNVHGYPGVGKTKGGRFYARIWDKVRGEQRTLPGTFATALEAHEHAQEATRMLADDKGLEIPSPKRHKKRASVRDVEPATIVVLAEVVPGCHSMSPQRVLHLMCNADANQLPVVPVRSVLSPAVYTPPNLSNDA